MNGVSKFLSLLAGPLLFCALGVFARNSDDAEKKRLDDFFSIVRGYSERLGLDVPLDRVLRQEVGSDKSIEDYTRALVRKIRTDRTKNFRQGEYLNLEMMAKIALADEFKKDFSRGFYEWYFASVPTYRRELAGGFYIDDGGHRNIPNLEPSDRRRDGILSLAALAGGDVFLSMVSGVASFQDHQSSISRPYLEDPETFKFLVETASPSNQGKLGEFEPQYGIVSEVPEVFVRAVPAYVGKPRKGNSIVELEHDFFGKKIRAFAARAEASSDAFSDGSLKSLIELSKKYAEPSPANEASRDILEAVREQRFEAEFDQVPTEKQLAFIQKVRAITSDDFAQSLWGRAFAAAPDHEVYRTVVQFLRERGDLGSDEKAENAYDLLFEHLDEKILPRLNPPAVENDKRVPYLRDGFLLKVAEDLVMDTSSKTDLALIPDLSVADVKRVLSLFGRDRVPTGFSRLENLPLHWLAKRTDQRFSKKDVADLEKYRETLVRTPRTYEDGQTLISDRMRMAAIRDRRRVPLHHRVLGRFAKPKAPVELPPTLPADCMFEALFAPDSTAKTKAKVVQ